MNVGPCDGRDHAYLGTPPVRLARHNIHYGWVVAGITFLTASIATGQLVFLPLLASLNEACGWRCRSGSC